MMTIQLRYKKILLKITGKGFNGYDEKRHMMSAIAFKRIKSHKSQIVFIATVLCICSMILLFCYLD